MKISIYNEPAGSGIGGSEFVAALLAEALAKEHQVSLFHRIGAVTRRPLKEDENTAIEDLDGSR